MSTSDVEPHKGVVVLREEVIGDEDVLGVGEYEHFGMRLWIQGQERTRVGVVVMAGI